MALQIIGVGVGRTGTYSLKLAINRLNFGPCHHMEAVLQNMPSQVPLWQAALSGKPDWSAIYAGFGSAVDWPTAGFFSELSSAFPDARFILTHRSPESWADSFGSTIYKMLSQRDEMPAEMSDWLTMGAAVIEKTGFPPGMDRDALMAGFIAHNDAVRAAIPSDRLLEFQVREGWPRLCEFLGVNVPDEPFPRSNDRLEFWDRVHGKV